MGRKAEQQSLEVKIPTFFRCPISLDVMKSPVSLCTGVTYDRASIQRWLDSGNTTCPATMQPLPSTDLVPNLTLQRLIHLWSSATSSPSDDTGAVPLLRRHHDFPRELRSGADPLPTLRRLFAFISDEDTDDYAKSSIVTACAPVLASILAREPSALGLESLEAVIEVLDLILSSDCIDDGSRKAAVSSLAADVDRSVAALIRVLKSGTALESRIGAARVLEASLTSISDPDSKARVAEKTDLIPELIRLVGPDEKLDRAAVEAGLGCLVAVLSGARRVRARMVRLGIVPVLARVLAEDAAVVPAAAAEKGLRLMEAAAGCAEGREAICEGAEGCLGAVLGRMMKVGREGTESAVVVLWSLCHLFRDRRAREAVSAAEGGGIAKFLLLMQSDCSPAARQMAGDLIRMFRVSSKSCLSGYDTKTTHIMPF